MRRRDPDWLQTWAEKFNSDANPRARNALNWMVTNRCDPTAIFSLLAVCTHPKADNYVVTVRVKSNLKERLRRLQRLNRQIRRTMEALHNVEKDSVVSHFRTITVELPHALNSATDTLKGVLLQKPFDNRKIPSGLALFELCLYVRRVTGAPSWSRLADLLQAGYQAHGATRIVDPKSLARKVRGFKKKHKLVAEALVEAETNLP